MSLTVINAESVKTIKLSFNKQQFSFATDEVGALEVSSGALLASYGEDTSQPGLPLVAVSVGVPNGVGFGGVSHEMTRQLLYENVVVSANPVELPTNYEGVLPKKTLPAYALTSYPKDNVQYVCTSTMDGYTILRFLVCPFEYDVQAKKLYLATNVTLNISLTDSPSAMSSNDSQEGQNMKEMFLSQIVNPEDFEEPQISTQSFDITPVPGLDIDVNPNSHITERYVIVTSKALAPYFEPLAVWKTTKGIKAKVVTVEDITAQHPEMDAQLAIKTFLYDEYKNNKLKYVLLGGSDGVVPSRKAYLTDTSLVDSLMPSDLYYACFDKCFSWDANGNGRYGEVADNISMEPSIIVTRAGVRDAKDVETFVNKVMGYEKNPKKNGWNNNILMSGVEMFYTSWKGQSDAEEIGEDTYNNNIAPYWNGERVRFYDTCTDFPGGADYDVTNDNLQYQLSQGYTFVDMLAHGNRDHWSIEHDSLYTTTEAHFLKNDKYTIITTMSCITNAFDTPWRSLSEEFLSNAQSGVVAYLGCSREGWFGVSEEYDAAFYRKLFSNGMVNRKFGEVVAAAKSSRLNYCSADNCNRMVQLGLNPLGDPEMPVYTDTPKTFDNVSIKYSADKKRLIVDAGVDSCSICFMSKADNGESRFYTLRYTRKAQYDISEPTSICITKQNYIPYVATRAGYIDRPQITQCQMNSDNKTVTVSTKLCESSRKAKVVVASTMGGAYAEYTVSAGSPTVIADLSNFADGVQTVTLFVDGENVDSKNILSRRS